MPGSAASRLLRPLATLLACLLHASPVAAQPVTIYRCTDAAGVLTVQNKPCPAGSTQREQQMQQRQQQREAQRQQKEQQRAQQHAQKTGIPFGRSHDDGK